MKKRKYHVLLSDTERQHLQKLTSENTEPNRTNLRAKILLALDSEERSANRKTVLALAEELGTTHTTIQTVKASYFEGGLDVALYRKKRTVTTVNKRINDRVIEQIINLAGQQPPGGRKHWSIRSLCQESVDKGIVSHIAPSTMQAVLRKANIDLKT